MALFDFKTNNQVYDAHFIGHRYVNIYMGMLEYNHNLIKIYAAGKSVC